MWKLMPKKYETVCFDFDKTICKDDKFGEPNKRIIKLMEDLYCRGFFIIVYTSRRQCDEHKIERWLLENKASYDLIKRGKPEAVAYIDDRALLPQSWFIKDIILSWSNKLKEMVSHERREY